jgi:hypothetical protein
MQVSSTTKVTADRLPSLMILDQDRPKKTEWIRFESLKKDEFLGDRLGFNIASLVARHDIKGKYEIYCDEEGMFKQYDGVNQLGNPFIAERQLLAMSLGGPMGPLAIIKKGGHSRAQLIKLFRAQDERDAVDEDSDDDDEEEGEEEEEQPKSSGKRKRVTVAEKKPGEYEAIILMALEEYDRKKKEETASE